MTTKRFSREDLIEALQTLYERLVRTPTEALRRKTTPLEKESPRSAS